MKFESEDEIKKALEIDSWKNLSRDKMVRFAAMMPDMDKEVALKVIEQFPEFTKFANEAMDVMEKEYVSTLASNKESQANVHRAFQEIRDILKGELKQDDLSFENRKYIMDLIFETGRMESGKDTENKVWLSGEFKKVLLGFAGGIAMAFVFVGGKFFLERDKESHN